MVSKRSQTDPVPTPVHGGNLEWASRFFGEPVDGWQDLSTGISPWGYPAPPVPDTVWQRLPAESNALSAAASEYYQVNPAHLVPLPGSQFGITQLPRLLPPARVALPVMGYAEHRRAWLDAGHQVIDYNDAAHLFELVSSARLDQGGPVHIVLLNPNNPSAERVTQERLLALYQRQHHGGRSGLLIVDEAFADFFPELSVLPFIERCPDLWVLRSVGKFFGLAGLRLGFLLGRDGHYSMAERMHAEVEPWGVSHPAQWLGAIALRDTHWQAQQRARLRQTSAELEALWHNELKDHAGLAQTGYSVDNAGLFVTLRGDWHSLHELYLNLGQKGILLRWCHWPQGAEETEAFRPWLRCGLPADKGVRLAQALGRISHLINARD